MDMFVRKSTRPSKITTHSVRRCQRATPATSESSAPVRTRVASIGLKSRRPLAVPAPADRPPATEAAVPPPAERPKKSVRWADQQPKPDLEAAVPPPAERPKKRVRWADQQPKPDLLRSILENMTFPPHYYRKVKSTPETPSNEVDEEVPATPQQKRLRREKTVRRLPFRGQRLHRLWKLRPGAYRLIDYKNRTALLQVGNRTVQTPLLKSCPSPPWTLADLSFIVESGDKDRVKCSWKAE